MAKDSTPGLKTSRNRTLLSHYHDFTQRFFTDGRDSTEQLNELFLTAVRNGDYERTENFLARASKHAAINVDYKEKKEGKTALMFAVENNNEKLVSLLLNYGADVTLCNNNGNSVLDYAPNNLKALLLGSVKRKGFLSKQLLQAAWQGDIESVKKALGSRTGGIDVNCRNADGMTPLLLVTRDVDTFEKIERAVIGKGYNPVAVVMELLNHKADCLLSDIEGRGPLHMAAHCKGKKAKHVLDTLLQKGSCNIDAQDSSRNSPIHWASKHDNCQVLLALIQNGADPNVRGNIGRTPLHWAASCGHEHASSTLLNHGADVTLVDDNGCSPVDLAQAGKVYSLLKEAWAEQTKSKRQSLKRICSAPALEHTLHLHKRSLSPQYLPFVEPSSPNNLVKQPNQKKAEQSVSQSQWNSKTSQLRVTSGKKRFVIPSPPSNGVTRPSFSAGEISSQKIPSEFPKLSVLNVELKYVRNLSAGTNTSFQSVVNRRQSSIPQRVYQRFSNPLPRTLCVPSSLTGNGDEKRNRSHSTSKLPNRSQLVQSRKTSVPSRVPPLPKNFVISPESELAASSGIDGPNRVNKVDVLDLDFLKSSGCLKSSTSKVVFAKDRETLPPPPPSLSSSPDRPSEVDTTQLELENELIDDKTMSCSDELNKTLTLSPTSSCEFWIPYKNSETSEACKNDCSSCANTDKPRKLRKQSLETFFVDLKEQNESTLQKEICILCGRFFEKTKEKKNQTKCKDCSSRKLSNTTDSFWISLESCSNSDIPNAKCADKETKGECLRSTESKNKLSSAITKIDVKIDDKDILLTQNNSKIWGLGPNIETSGCSLSLTKQCNALGEDVDQSSSRDVNNTVESKEQEFRGVMNKTWSKDDRDQDCQSMAVAAAERSASRAGSQVDIEANEIDSKIKRSSLILSSFECSEVTNSPSTRPEKDIKSNTFDKKETAKVCPGSHTADISKNSKTSRKKVAKTTGFQEDGSVQSKHAWISPRNKKPPSDTSVFVSNFHPSQEHPKTIHNKVTVHNEKDSSSVAVFDIFPSSEPPQVLPNQKKVATHDLSSGVAIRNALASQEPPEMAQEKLTFHNKGHPSPINGSTVLSSPQIAQDQLEVQNQHQLGVADSNNLLSPEPLEKAQDNLTVNSEKHSSGVTESIVVPFPQPCQNAQEQLGVANNLFQEPIENAQDKLTINSEYQPSGSIVTGVHPSKISIPVACNQLKGNKDYSPSDLSVTDVPLQVPPQIAQDKSKNPNELCSPSVIVANAFPSPELPHTGHFQPAIHNSIAIDSSKKITKSKSKAKKSKSAKNTQNRTANKLKTPRVKSSDARIQTGKNSSNTKKETGKKKYKVKRKAEIKIIDVNQSSIEGNNDAAYSATDISGPPTLCLDSHGKTFNTHSFRGKFIALSPIPESPRISQETGTDTTNPAKDSNYSSNELTKSMIVNENFTESKHSEENNEHPEKENVSESKISFEKGQEESEELCPVTADNVCDNNLNGIALPIISISNPSHFKQSDDTEPVENVKLIKACERNSEKEHNSATVASNVCEQENICDAIDEVDGGFFSKFIGHCVPRLKMKSSGSESQLDSCEPEPGNNPFNQNETNVQLENRIQNVTQWDPVDIPAIKDEIRKLIPDDEADTDIEDLLSDVLEQENISDKSRSFQKHYSEIGRVFTPDREIVNSNIELNDKGCLNHISQDANDTLYSSKDVGRKEHNKETSERELEPVSRQDTFSSLSSLSTEGYHDHCSDTDSSYNSCGSTPRPFSDENTSSFDSDSYFSSPRDSSCTSTPTSYCGDCSSNSSVDINLYERGFMKISTRHSSSSNSSNSTLKGISVSQGSVGSGFLLKEGEKVVHSRLGNCSTSSSEEEEIVWKKGNLLGKGAFGMVYCGLTNKGQMIAVKQVELNISDETKAEKQYEKLQEEVALLKSLKHENIVRYIGTCLDGGVVNIFMEYVPGGSIANLLARFGSLDEPVFRRYTKQILLGVEYLHQNNVIHRDIKGGNIMLMPSGVIKLIDFGCAKRLCIHLSLSKSNILRSMKGTPYWMAPEVIKETGHGRKSDIWSVGCSVYEMATRRPPWSNMPPMTAIFAIGSGSQVPQLGEEFSRDARDFVKFCLTREPEFRPSAEELLQHEFIRDCS